MKNNNLFLSSYRFIIVFFIILQMKEKTDVIQTSFLIDASLLVIYAVVLSVLNNRKTNSYIEWLVVLVIIFHFHIGVLSMFLIIAPMMRLIVYELNKLEIMIISISAFLTIYYSGSTAFVATSIALAVFVFNVLTNEHFKRAGKLEDTISEVKKENEDMNLELSKKDGQIKITAELFFHKNLLQEVRNTRELINKLIDSAFRIFNADYVAFYFFKDGRYIKVGETGDPGDRRVKDMYLREEGSTPNIEDEELHMPIFFQKQPWGKLFIVGKKTVIESSALVLEIPFEDRDFETLSMLLETAMYRLREIKRQEKLELAAFSDKLTNLPNRANLENKMFSLMLNEAKKREEELYVIMLDIDNFKSFNDSFGHDIGDKVLISVSKVLKSISKKSKNKGIVGRWGGEEFLGFFVGNKEGAFEFSELIRQEIENYDFEERKITVSIGISEFDFSETKLDEVVKRADIALYQSKSDGKNQVTINDNRSGSEY